jgi:hypothetical protein
MVQLMDDQVQQTELHLGRHYHGSQPHYAHEPKSCNWNLLVLGLLWCVALRMVDPLLSHSRLLL